MIKYGATSEKVVWPVFKRKLSAHFSSYHRIAKHYDTWALFQCRSCFEGVDGWTKDPADTNNASADTQDSSRHLPNNKFNEIFVAQCDEQGRISESEEALLKRVFEFFLPVLDFQLKKSKEKLQDIDVYLRKWRLELGINESTIQDTVKQHNTPDTTVAWVHGHSDSSARPQANREISFTYDTAIAGPAESRGRQRIL